MTALGEITPSTIEVCERLAGIQFTPVEREQMAKTVGEQVASFQSRAKFGELPNALAPAQVFRVMLPGEAMRAPTKSAEDFFARKQCNAPASSADFDFATIEQLSAWIVNGKVTSRQLVERSLARLRAVNASHFCVITLVEAQALREADALDAETRVGKSRGPLHGIPYGLKDLFDTANITTTWGAEPWRDRVPTDDAAIVTRLRDAGAVLVAKTALGALAYGDIWFGGTCRNPWNPTQGSSGSSAGSASVVASGCVPFAIGTETLGSIVSPCTRCGTTGLRPTFGRVSRHGAMALCWSWDKVGPIARSVIDTGIVLEVLNAQDDRDPSSVAVAFTAPRMPNAKGFRVGYDKRWFEGSNAASKVSLDALTQGGAVLVEKEITPPCDPSVLVTGLMCEAAACFEQLTRSNADDTLAWQADEAWPNSFRQTWFVPAIEFVQAERIRRRFMEWMRIALADCDALVLPPFAGGLLVITNATGHPTLCMREGFDSANEPRSITLIGHPFDEASLLKIGSALEATLDVARMRPELLQM
ncbi:MAG: amidase [Phycisphaerales bacterium]|nr:amidase [Phycisphaerales bacterium]